jgi:hypothetical protein
MVRCCGLLFAAKRGWGVILIYSVLVGGSVHNKVGRGRGKKNDRPTLLNVLELAIPLIERKRVRTQNLDSTLFPTRSLPPSAFPVLPQLGGERADAKFPVAGQAFSAPALECKSLHFNWWLRTGTCSASCIQCGGLECFRGVHISHIPHQPISTTVLNGSMTLISSIFIIDCEQRLQSLRHKSANLRQSSK